MPPRHHLPAAAASLRIAASAAGTGKPTTKADAPTDPIRYVFIERARCPACGSDKLRTIRSQTDRRDGTVTRRTQCQACFHRFFVVLE